MIDVFTFPMSFNQTNNINMIDVCIFPTSLNSLNSFNFATPVYGVWKRTLNYRPVSILPNASKIYENCLFNPPLKHFTVKETSMRFKERWHLCTILSDIDDKEMEKACT